MPPIRLKISLSGLPRVPAPPVSDGDSAYDDEASDSRASTSRTTPAPIDSVAMSRVTSEEDGYSSSQSVPGPSTIKLTIPQAGPSTPSIPPTPSYTPMSTPGGSEAQKKKRGRPPKARPSAIPPHLAAPPRSPAYSRSPPVSTPQSDTNVKLERFDDELDLIGASNPDSPSGWGVYTPNGESSATPGWRENSIETPGSRAPAKWKRIRRPFKELADKVLIEMRRKDEYGFFLDPVQVDEYPGYLEIIGGEERMMDLGTMQSKVTSGEYRSMDDLEADFKMMIENALKFNLPGTAAHHQANKLKSHGQKHIDRNRPLVLSPSPSVSPSRQNSALPDSQRATPSRGTRGKDLKPHEYIPEQMLHFPPNSAQALAVGWNLTGGRRVRAKRFVRGRERFQGKWRDWAPDGSRDIAEMDDPDEVLEEMRARPGEQWGNIVDWERMHREATAWYDWDGIGGPNGQAPLPGADKLKPPELPKRDLNHFDFGSYPEVQFELQRMRNRPASQAEEDDAADLATLANHLRPHPPRAPKLPNGWPAQTFQNIYDAQPAADFVQTLGVGGVNGEAYMASARRFLQGALKSSGSDEAVAKALHDYVTERWHGGLLSTRTTRLVDDTVNGLSAAASKDQQKVADPALLDSARTAYSRIALRSLTAATNPLDLMPLLREPADFMHVGVGGKSGVSDALKWVGDEIIRLAQGGARDNAQGKAAITADPAVKTEGGLKRTAPESAEQPDAKRAKAEDGTPVNGTPPTTEAIDAASAEGGLRQLRLELVALSKFYPLASLKKMPASDAARLLPQNVRGLMTRN